jgi:hypothetical protein
MTVDGMLRELFLGFMRVHVLYHAGEGPVYGAHVTGDRGIERQEDVRRWRMARHRTSDDQDLPRHRAQLIGCASLQMRDRIGV